LISLGKNHQKDGLWVDSNGHSLVTEVKTTDAYRINLDTVTEYREALITTGKVTKESSVLIVVGRQDTGDLEAQVRGSKHAWSIRLISADALAKLVALKENGDLDSVAKIHELLIPFEYTKLDKIIEITFTVAKDTTAVLNEERAEDTDSLASGQDGVKQQHTPPEMISALRNSILESLTHSYAPLVKKSRALYWSADKSVRLVVTISKRYETGEGGYWYAYHSDWDTFLSEAAQGFSVLGCIGRKEAYALPYAWIHSRLKNLNHTEREGKSHWHIILNPDETGTLTLRLNNGQNEQLENFKIALAN
jgi:hypothetical protein